MKRLLAFIENKDLFREVENVIEIARKASINSEIKLHRNVIDPFSALFDSTFQGISLNDWMRQEKSRQMQKTLQNALGVFHQGILGSMPGWENMGNGNVFDLKNKGKKIIAEVKNKYNTTKGNNKMSIYDDLESQINGNYPGYTSYYIEVIPARRKVYDKLFTPPDNRTGERRPENDKIRVIDGKSFYAMASGYPNAIKELYIVLPVVIGKILDIPANRITKGNFYLKLFDRVY